MSSEIELLTFATLKPSSAPYLLASHMSAHQNDSKWIHSIIVPEDPLDFPGHLWSCPNVRVMQKSEKADSGSLPRWVDSEWVAGLGEKDALPPHSLDYRVQAGGAIFDWVSGNLDVMLPNGDFMKLVDSSTSAKETLSNEVPYLGTVAARVSFLNAVKTDANFSGPAEKLPGNGTHIEETVYWYRDADNDFKDYEEIGIVRTALTLAQARTALWLTQLLKV